MNDQSYPPGWDEERVNRLLAHYENVSEEQQVAEDELAAEEHAGQAVISVPQELLPKIRTLMATQENS